MALHLLPDGTIEVRAPNLIPKFLINNFIKRNSGWIEKRIGTVKKHASKVKKYVDGEKFSYLGNGYTFLVGNYSRIEIKDKNILFPRAVLFRAKKEIDNWYIQRAREIIKDLLIEYSKEMKTSYTSVAFSDTRSKWGSCTHDNRLQFNYRLILAPLLVVRYVVIHELAHTVEKNHSRAFWNLVRSFNPSYKEQIKWLKLHGSSLTI